jgi:uroporphyrinogen-III synthase
MRMLKLLNALKLHLKVIKFSKPEKNPQKLWGISPLSHHLRGAHFGILAVTSAKTDKIFWKIFEETLSRWLIRKTFLQIFSHPHFRF